MAFGGGGFGGFGGGGFGQSNPFQQSQSSVFGGSPAFGQPSSSAFGSTMSSSAFGFGASQGGFGVSSSPFGGGGSGFTFSPTGNSQMTFGGGVSSSGFGFGQPTGQGFGASQPFGGTGFQQSSSPFGGSMFGNQQSSQAMGFGISSSVFSSFGQPQSSTAFGAFGAGTSQFGMQQQAGTASADWSKTTLQEAAGSGNVTTSYFCISAMPQYQNKSPEELRLEDYQANRKGIGGGGMGVGGGLQPTQSSPFGPVQSSSPFINTWQSSSSLFQQTQPTFQVSSSPFSQPFPSFNPQSSSVFPFTQSSNPFNVSSSGFTLSSQSNAFNPASGNPFQFSSPLQSSSALSNPSSIFKSFGPSSTSLFNPQPASVPSFFNPSSSAFTIQPATVQSSAPQITFSTWQQPTQQQPTQVQIPQVSVNPYGQYPQLPVIPPPKVGITASKPGTQKMPMMRPIPQRSITNLALKSKKGAQMLAQSLRNAQSPSRQSAEKQTESNQENKPFKLKMRKNFKELFIGDQQPEVDLDAVYDGFKSQGNYENNTQSNRNSQKPSSSRGGGGALNFVETPETPETRVQSVIDIASEKPVYQEKVKYKHYEDEYNEEVLPKITDANYYIRPTLAQLRAMLLTSGEEELAKVSNFSIGCQDFGEVVFLQSVDVRRMDVCSLVRFQKGGIEVFYDEEVDKPEIGTSLNKPAEVTLFQMYKADPETGQPMMDQASIEKFRRKLDNICSKQQSTMISYSPEKQIWKFRVEHFSKYGYESDSESEAENVAGDRERGRQLRELQQRQQLQNRTSEALLQTPHNQAFGSLLNAGSSGGTGTPVISSDHIHAMRRALFVSPTAQPGLVLDDLDGVYAEDFGGFDQIQDQWTQQQQQEARQYQDSEVWHRVPSVTCQDETDDLSLSTIQPVLPGYVVSLPSASVKSLNYCVHDVGLCMRGSFRVGWGQHGFFVVPGVKDDRSNISIRQIIPGAEFVPSSSEGDIDQNHLQFLSRQQARIQGLLQVHKQNSQLCKDQDSDSPFMKFGCNPDNIEQIGNQLASVEQEIIDEGSEVGHLEKKGLYHEQGIWKLISALYRRIPPQQQDQVFDEDSQYSQRNVLFQQQKRNKLFTEWLRQQCKFQMESRLQLCNSVPSMLIQLLAGLQTHTARKLASSCGYPKVNTLIGSVRRGQTRNVLLSALREQINIWQISGFIPGHIEGDLITLLQVLSGDVRIAQQRYMMSLPWHSALGLYYWYTHVTDVKEAFDMYFTDVEKAEASHPGPYYCSQQVGREGALLDVQFYILTLYSGILFKDFREAHICAVQGITPDRIDYLVSWLIGQLLRGLDVLSGEGANMDIVYTVSNSLIHYIDIVGAGLTWCIYVALQLPNHSTWNGLRERIVKHLLQQHVFEWIKNEQELIELGVPVKWVEEAKAYMFKYLHEYKQEMFALKNAGDVVEAHDLFVSRIGPQMFVRQQLDQLYQLANQFVQDYRDLDFSVGAELYQQFIGLMQKYEKGNMDNEQEAIMQLRQNLEKLSRNELIMEQFPSYGLVLQRIVYYVNQWNARCRYLSCREQPQYIAKLTDYLVGEKMAEENMVYDVDILANDIGIMLAQ